MDKSILLNLLTPSMLGLNVDNRKELKDDGIFKVKEPIKFRSEIQELMKQNAGIIRQSFGDRS